jgi:hypothetical protein
MTVKDPCEYFGNNYMKYFLITTTILIQLTAAAQSPYLSILVKMDSIKAGGTRYKIEMNICEPKKKSERGDWFTHDTSTIDFASLRSNDIECGGYFDNGMPTLISGTEEELVNQFKFSGQVFVWEKIFVFKISNRSSRGWMPEMYIVMPVKYKSFWTHIDITDIEFQSGKVIFLKDLKGIYGETDGSKYLSFNLSLKNEKGVDVKTFPLKELLEKN